jgi:methyl-accepting chemotaxis protein
VRLVGETGAALTRIIERIAEIDSLVGDIAASAEQQATGLQQVNTAVAEMDGVTQQNAAMVEQSTAAARSLASDADDMARQIARFRIGTPETPVKAAAAPVAIARRRVTPKSVGNAALAVHDDDWAAF